MAKNLDAICLKMHIVAWNFSEWIEFLVNRCKHYRVHVVRIVLLTVLQAMLAISLSSATGLDCPPPFSKSLLQKSVGISPNQTCKMTDRERASHRLLIDLNNSVPHPNLFFLLADIISEDSYFSDICQVVQTFSVCSSMNNCSQQLYVERQVSRDLMTHLWENPARTLKHPSDILIESLILGK